MPHARSLHIFPANFSHLLNIPRKSARSQPGSGQIGAHVGRKSANLPKIFNKCDNLLEKADIGFFCVVCGLYNRQTEVFAYLRAYFKTFGKIGVLWQFLMPLSAFCSLEKWS